MNTPNKLTVLRMALIPVFLVFALIPSIPNSYFLAMIIFIIASITDFLDGYIARKYNLVTNFGKFFDPLADKLLVMAAMICLIPLQAAPPIVVIIILAREFLITSLRLVAASKGVVLAADILGKIKTVLQLIWITLGLLLMGLIQSNIVYAFRLGPLGDYFEMVWAVFYYGYYALMIAVVLITVISGFNYIVKNFSLFVDLKEKTPDLGAAQEIGAIDPPEIPASDLQDEKTQ